MDSGTPTPDDVYKVGLMLFRQGHHGHAQVVCHTVLQAEPAHVPSLCLLGDIQASAGQVEEALQCYDLAHQLKPTQALASTRASCLRFRQVWGPPSVPRHPDSGRDVLQLSSLGARDHFGHQLLQYAFARLLAQRQGLELQAADWVGRDLYDLDDPLPQDLLHRVDEKDVHPDCFEALKGQYTDPPLRNVDLHGRFVGDTARWAPYKLAFQDLFRPGARLRPGLGAVIDGLRRQGRTLVVVHLRHHGAEGSAAHPAGRHASWCQAALERLWPTLAQPVLYIASNDQQAATRSEFTGFSPVQVDPQGLDMPGLSYFIDHHIMTQADVLLASDSAFALTAAMLNVHGQQFHRADEAQQAIVPFDPWDAPATSGN